MWSAPAKNMKKINMSISFVYNVSIRGNCENAVFTFLLFYKQNINVTQQKEPFWMAQLGIIETNYNF